MIVKVQSKSDHEQVVDVESDEIGVHIGRRLGGFAEQHGRSKTGRLATAEQLLNAPDGPAAANPWADYNNAASGTGTYRVDLTGACLIGGAPCPCDLNNDNVVDISDLALLLANFGTAGPIGDINASGVVDISDLALILACFGTNCP